MTRLTISSLQAMYSSSCGKVSVRNPYDNMQIGWVPDRSDAQVKEAINNAQEAFLSWSAQTAKERSVYLRKWHDLILAHTDDLAEIMTLEQGKPLAEAKGEIRYAASFVEWFSEEARRIYGDVIPSHLSDTTILVLQEPVGVCAAITPWNFPAAMITRKAAAALAAGCTMLVKPSGKTPFSALALEMLAKEAGIPQGVLTVVTGDSSRIGQLFCTDPVVRKLSFTGSTDVGKQLMRRCADGIKRLSLELGGNAPAIICEDADIAKAVAGVMVAKYRNAGQTCIAANRIFVHRARYEAFTQALMEQVSKLTYGNGMHGNVVQGPLINEKALDHVSRLVEDATLHGAQIMLGGKRDGQCFEPTILTGVTEAMAITQEEIFGPVAPLIPFESDEQVVAMANNTPYGLAAYLFTESRSRAWKIAGQLESGMVAVNEGRLSTEVAPFGGIKASGFGREGSYHGMEEYLQLKYLLLGA